LRANQLYARLARLQFAADGKVRRAVGTCFAKGVHHFNLMLFANSALTGPSTSRIAIVVVRRAWPMSLQHVI